MKIKIELAQKGQASECLSCVRQSDLWEAYFKSNPQSERDIADMIESQRIYVACDEENNCVGFMGVVEKGCFGKFSYLSIIAVKNEYRSKGIGAELLRNFEEIGFESADKVFLLVSDFNLRAQKLYHKIGYQKVGSVPNLYKDGIAEHILVKYRR